MKKVDFNWHLCNWYIYTYLKYSRPMFPHWLSLIIVHINEPWNSQTCHVISVTSQVSCLVLLHKSDSSKKSFIIIIIIIIDIATGQFLFTMW